MNPYQFLKQVQGIPTGNATTGLGGGDGFRREIQLIPPAAFRTAAGLVLDGSTTAPKVVLAETNALVIQAALATTALGSFVFAVPKDYDPASDVLELKLTANSAGNTDSPTLNATIYSKRQGKALTAALTTVASAAAPKSATPATAAAELTVSASGNGLLPDDILTINLTSGAHTTDALNLYGCDIVYKTNFVLTDMAQR